MPETLKVNRVDIGSTTLIDISDTTATASDVAQGKEFYLADGNKATGTAVPSTPTGTIKITENDTYDVSQYASADVYVEPKLEYVTITENGRYEFSPTTLISCPVEAGTHTYDYKLTDFVYSSNVIVWVSAYTQAFVLLMNEEATWQGQPITLSNADLTVVIGATGATVTTERTDIDYFEVSINSDGVAFANVNVQLVPTLQNKIVTPTKSTQTVQADSGYDGLSQVTVNAIPSEYIIPTGTISITLNQTGLDVSQYASANIAVPSSQPTLQSKSVTPTESAQTITPDSGYDGLSQVDVGAIDSEYVGSEVYRPEGLMTAFTDQELLGRKSKLLLVSAQAGYYESSDSYSAPEAIFNFATSVSINSSGDATVTFSPETHGVAYEVETYTVTKTGAVTPRTSSDLTASGATVTAPAGYYSTSASKSVASGTEGTPTAAKGTVSNHQVSVTPSVTNTAGYISGGTHAGTPVTVTAAELVSGSETKTANGTYDVTNLAELIVNVASGGGGLEYETGTWSPGEDIARGTISFSNTHTEAPIIVALSDATGTASSTTNSNHCFMYWDYYKAFGVGIPYSSSGYRYAHVTYSYRASNTSSLSQATTVCTNNSNSTTASGTSYPRYWVNVSEFYPYTNSTSRYWRAGRTFKWIAIWKPTT